MQSNTLYKILFQNLQEMSLFEKSELEKSIEHLTCVNHQVNYQTGFVVYCVVGVTILIIVLVNSMFLDLQTSIHIIREAVQQ